MRASLILLPLTMLSAPAMAQSPAPVPVAPAPVAPVTVAPEAIQLPPELTDPRVADRLGDMMQVLSKAFLNLPVGEIQAAAEGRRATAQEKRITIRDLERRHDPNFERRLERQIADTKPLIRSSMQAMTEALPAMMKGMMEASAAIERAAANMPRPDYPKR